MYRKLTFFFIFLIVTGNTLVAQGKWNLARCISFSLENNIGLKKMEIEKKIASEDLNQSKRDLLPGISASSRAGISFGRSIDPNTNGIINTQFFNNSYDLGTSMTLFNGFKLLNQIEYQKFRKRATELNRINAVDDLAFSVMNSYFDVLYYKGMLKIAEEQVETSRINLKKINKQVELGMKSKTDLLEMSANFETEELRRIQVGNSLKTAVLQLKQRMNLTDTTEMVLDEEQSPMEVSAKPDQRSLFSAYTQWSPYYQSFEAQLKASRKMLAISRSQLYPSLSANASMGTGFYETTKDETGKTIAFSTQLENNRNKYVGGSLNIPIFSRWAVRSDIKKAKLQVEQAQNTLDEEKQKLYFEMANNLNDLEALEKEYNQYQKQQDADQLAFQAAERKFEQGLVSVVDFYIAKNRLANSASQVLNARLHWEIKKKALDFYSGKRFWE
ncbi:type I secretion system, outer membrane component LapE [Aquipluma nitroreducens]|uniref:Type I secretion system, outer membrane component LapE n=1 Tax=Aquipluma nitroreducens TaxID=2010828 RepID=A0A5K7S9Y7_9BACT|nr:TolC family protein [Aquipluma nitroreducens]BBE18398.1 type I secretion system, outer membrane component LapE [Aquipluma nitroreducens]